MNLEDIYYSKYASESDKGTDHSYIKNYYNVRFNTLKNKRINLLEIGISRGASIKLWKDWFTDCNIVGIDHCDWADTIVNIPNVRSFKKDAYLIETVNLFEDNFFDIIIDDGPHTLESQMFSAKHWFKKLKPGGIMVIEDIDKFDKIDLIIRSVSEGNFTYKIWDFREYTNRWDDVIVEILKN